MLNPEVTVAFDDHLEDLMNILSLARQLVPYFKHLMHVELCDEVVICITNVIHDITRVTPCRFQCLNAED